MIKLISKTISIIAFLAFATKAEAGLSQETIDKARKSLTDNCYSIFTGKKERLFTPKVGYQDYIGSNRVFMIAEDYNGNQTCGYQWGGILRYSHKELEDILCDKMKSKNWKNCILFAKDNVIVFLSIEELLDKANNVYQQDNIEEVGKLLDEINSRGLSSVPIDLRGKFYFLKGIVAAKGSDFSVAIDNLILSWNQYANVDAAITELNLLSSQNVSQHWKKIREAYSFIKDKGETSAIGKYNQLFDATEPFYNAEQSAKAYEEKIAREQELQKRELAEKEDRERALTAEKEAKIKAIAEAKEEKERLKAEAREAKKIAEQQRIEMARSEKESSLALRSEGKKSLTRSQAPLEIKKTISHGVTN